jgi:hypothetical protein
MVNPCIRNHHGRLAASPAMNGTKEKREENERVISMEKKANAFFSPGSSFFTIFTKK